MIEFFNPTDAPAPGAFSRSARFGVASAANVAFACIAPGPDAARAR
jgi:hypothetical protein